MATEIITGTGAVVRNPTQTVIRCNADEFMVRWGSRSRTSHQLKDDQRRGLLADLVERLAIPAEQTEIARWYPDVDPNDVQQVLESLMQHRVVVTLEQAESGFLELGFDLGSRSGLAHRTVGVIGDGAIAGADP